ncbi:hypothetical protein G6F43_011883 [Rhizopus delemar]|nr:hypothetical protein G6F43_011883 [Rhizopus delemar]
MFLLADVWIKKEQFVILSQFSIQQVVPGQILGSDNRTFLNPNEYCIQWGDTISRHLSLVNLHFKLDFRLIVKDFDNNELDVITGELARHSSTIPSKMYRDFLKSALTTKIYLSATLKRMTYIPPNKMKTVVAPMIQIMRLSCIIYGMNIIDKKVYTLQKLCTFNYPSTLREVKSGGMTAMINGFGLIESMIKNIEAMIIEFSITPSNAMSNIKNGRKKSTTAKTIDIDEYISTVIPCPGSGNEDKQEEDEQEDEEQ